MFGADGGWDEGGCIPVCGAIQKRVLRPPVSLFHRAFLTTEMAAGANTQPKTSVQIHKCSHICVFVCILACVCVYLSVCLCVFERVFVCF